MLNILDAAFPPLYQGMCLSLAISNADQKRASAAPLPAVVSARFLLINTNVPNGQSLQTHVGSPNFTGYSHILPESPHM